MTDNKSGSNVYEIPSTRCFTDDQETSADTIGIYRHYQMLSAGKPVLAADKCEGLSCLPGQCWSDLSAKTDLPWQFGPPGSSLDVDSQYITVEESPIPGLGGDLAVSKDCKKGSESELEWQWIMDQQQTYKSEWFSTNKFEEDTTTTEDEPSNKPTHREEGLKRAETDSSTITTSSLFSGSKTEGSSSDAGTSNSSKVSGNLSVELSAAKAYSHRDCAVWRTADSKELAALVSQKGHGYLENCDLPHSQSSFTWKGPLTNSVKDMRSANSSADKVLLASLLCRQEPRQSMQFECSSSTSEPQPIPSPFPRSSSINSFEDQKTTAWKTSSGRHIGVSKHGGFEALGEALCHSQTRARQAEKLAAQALQEREKLARLLFRESWTARTYKQWVQTLELENMWLKMWDMEVWMGKELSDISSAAEQMVLNPLKHNTGKHASRKKTHHHLLSAWEGRRHHKHGCVPESSVWLRCTIGLAFALGLSFAGAGLMIGWSMGWILLSC
ncbi:hypothetical protein GOP47_0009692 [Adiantum capillus-veneris]|uniref:Uncharacterized protein n=1 Tax=Adiantum capillus-veneris TaxID=13818 RepID=A0A9D4UX40_ADICA|nr:hypothetical protein GOP47_0009692 [Adiantum capillus-veneris]